MSSVVFAGCARSCARHLPSVLRNLERWEGVYDRSAFVIVENGSDDDTKAILSEWLARRSDGHLVEVAEEGPPSESRTTRMARLRNLYLDFIEGGALSAFDHVVVLDFDEPSAMPMSAATFQQARDWLDRSADAAGVFANARPTYYDIWALRHPAWSPDDCWEKVNQTRARLGSKAAIERYVSARQISIDPRAAPIPVQSAFGGLGIYKLQQIKGSRYVGVGADGVEVCEHVPFNAAVGANGRQLFVLPSLVVQTPNEHVQPAPKGPPARRPAASMSPSPTQGAPKPAPTGACRLCHGSLVPWSRKTILQRYAVDYFRCAKCESVQTETPYWLDEAYAIEGIGPDVGAAQRTLNSVLTVSTILDALDFPRDAACLDYGAGVGLFVRMMRDRGYDFRSQDAYAKPFYSDNFVAGEGYAPKLTTAFEVFEHFPRPHSDLEAVFKGSPDLLIVSTELYTGQADDWWYLAPEGGQHVFFFSPKAMAGVAARFGYRAVALRDLVVFARQGGPYAADLQQKLSFLRNPAAASRRGLELFAQHQAAPWRWVEQDVKRLEARRSAGIAVGPPPVRPIPRSSASPGGGSRSG